MLSQQSAGAALREAREAAGLSRERLAALAGVSMQTVVRVEHDSVRPTANTLHALRLALGQQPPEPPPAATPEVAPWASELAKTAHGHEDFEAAVTARVRAAALGHAVREGGGDPEAAGRAAGAADDRGAAMADAVLDDLDPAERERIFAAAAEHVSRGVVAAAIALVIGATRVDLDAPDLDEVDLPTLVRVGVGLVAR